MRRNFDDYKEEQPPQGDTFRAEDMFGSEDALRDLFSRYEGKSEQEVLSEILFLAKQGKQNGTLTGEEIDRYAAVLSPMLGESQRKKLQKIVEKLKNS